MWAFPYSCLEARQLLVKIKPKVTTIFILCEELLALQGGWWVCALAEAL